MHLNGTLYAGSSLFVSDKKMQPETETIALVAKALVLKLLYYYYQKMK